YTASSYLSEIFGRYYLNVSSDYLGAKNGINGFTRFSVVNAEGIILPVSVINLKAYQKNNGIQVDWSALNELNIDNYEVQRSGNGISFTPMVKIIARNNGVSNIYTAFDATPSVGNNFYRIKTLDKNGAVSYTGIVSVNLGGKPGISIQPNPVQNRVLNLQLSNLAAGNYSMMFYSISGQPIYNKMIAYGGGSFSQLMLLPANVRPGVYILRVYNSSNNFSLPVVVQ
ncbi:MAG: T9SS type A sorting domain-containing protein, partial [Panacibacter sp.]